jgi:hypothetical protein
MPGKDVKPYLHGTPLPRAKAKSGDGMRSAFKAGLAAVGCDDKFKVGGKSASSTRKMSDTLKPMTK